MFLVLRDPLFLAHASPCPHPENPGRLVAIEEGLMKHPLPEIECRSAERNATLDELALVHTPEYIEKIRATSQVPYTQLDTDTYATSQSYEIATRAAGTLLYGIDQIMKRKERRLFALVRPPGHHAEKDRAMGFCLFNNIALAAQYAKVRHKLKRIAIYDFDLHHGNGTQHIFYSSPEVFYCSHHQFPFYPGTGNFSEVGEGNGKGFTLNAPLPSGSGNKEVLFLWDRLFEPVLRKFSPQLLLLSAGFDAHVRDPLGQLEITDEGFNQLFARLERFANDLEIPLLYALEGGYDGHALSFGVRSVLRSHIKPDKIGSIVAPSPVGIEVLEQAHRNISPYFNVS